MIQTSTIIFENNNGAILLFLRDNKPNIPDPNKWDLFGGFGEEGENAEETIVREIKEELNLDLEDFELFKVFNWDNKIQTVFYKKLDINPSDVDLQEGQTLKYFSKDDILSMDLANTAKQILIEYFNK